MRPAATASVFDRHHAAEMRQRNILKPLVGFRVTAALTTRAKADRPVIPFVPSQCDLPGRVGRNRKRGNLGYRKMQLLRASPGVGSLVAKRKPHFALSSPASTGRSVCAFRGERPPVKHEFGGRFLIGFAGTVPRAAGKESTKGDHESGRKKSHRGNLIDN